MGKIRVDWPRAPTWTRFDQELKDLSDSVKNKLERQLEELRLTKQNLEDRIASVHDDIEDVQKAKSLVTHPDHPMGRSASVESYMEDLKEAESIVSYSLTRSASVADYIDLTGSPQEQSMVSYDFSRRQYEPYGRTKLYIDNLYYKIRERDLEKYFAKYGTIVDVYIVRSRLTKISRGYGYVDFYREYSAEDAIDDAKNEPHMIHGRYITVRYASEHAAENRAIHGPRHHPYMR